MGSLRELFGGAVTMTVPDSFLDASDIRQIPDTQEVFLDPDSDISFIVEILQRVDADDDRDAAKLHFDALAHDNSALSQKILDIIVPPVPQPESPPETPYPIVLRGEQTVQKFNRVDADNICILLALYRIKGKGADMVLTANIPLSTSSAFSDSNEATVQVATANFEAASQSLKIVDFGLFV